MPAPLKVDWEQAKLLRAEGLSYPEIAQRLSVKPGTVTVRAWRERWDEKITATKEAVLRPVMEDVAKSLRQRGVEWEQRIARLVERRIAFLETLDPARLKLNELKTLTEVTDLTDKIGRRTFGLDSGAKSLVVGVSMRLGTWIQPQEAGDGPGDRALAPSSRPEEQPTVDVHATVSHDNTATQTPDPSSEPTC